MSYWDAIILGVVEGLTEFLPVSSTGHLILAADLLRLPETDFLQTFQVAIQLGAILAVGMLYWKRILFDRELDKKILVALLPALAVGAVFFTEIKSLFDSTLTVVAALFAGGIVLVIFEWRRLGRPDEGMALSSLSYRTALGIGLFQALAVIPGVSRAGATILGGLALGLNRKAIVEFSFLLALPTMVAATSLDLWKHRGMFSIDDLELLLVGCGTSFLVAVAAVKMLLRYVETNTFIAFGIYRILLAAVFFFFFLEH